MERPAPNHTGDSEADKEDAVRMTRYRPQSFETESPDRPEVKRADMGALDWGRRRNGIEREVDRGGPSWRMLQWGAAGAAWRAGCPS